MTSAEKHYRTLGIEPGASLKEIKEAYRDLASVWHPDRFANNPRLQEKAQETLKEINAAYEYLRTYSVNDQPRLMEIAIVPQTVQLNLGESQVFRLFGLDQNRSPINISHIDWSATGGTISSGGCFLAECDGCFIVTASVEDLNSSVYVTVVKPSPKETTSAIKNEVDERDERNSPKSDVSNNYKEKKKLRNSRIFSFVRLMIWSFWGLLLLTPVPSQKQPLISVLPIPIMIFCLSAFLIGLISPSLVLTFGLRRNRNTVTLLYLPPFLIYLFSPSYWWIPLIVIETSLWVVVDAKQIGVKKGQLGGGFFDRGRWEWFFLCLLLWIIGFPSYLLKRAEYVRQNKTSSTGES